MSAATDPLALAAEFPGVGEDDWRALLRGVLRKSGLAEGADPVEALSTTTYEGIRIRPLYTSGPAPAGEPGVQPYARGATADGATAAGWDVRTWHRNPDPSAGNAAVLNDLATGATSVWLTVGDAGIAVSDLGALLDGVYLDLAPVALDAGRQTEDAARALLALAADRGIDAAELCGSFGADPIGRHARTGDDADLALLGRLAEIARPHPRLCIASVDASIYHDAGASDAAEIAIATSVGVAYLRALTEAGLSVDDALAALEFRLAVSTDQFTSIAKLRAARQVWGRVAQLSSAAPDARGQRQHAVTSAAMMTRRDPWVNLLRTTIACFAAAVGGADAITVLPFETALGLPDDFARRIARNTHAVLHDESGVGRVVDAAGGSWYVETLTAELAEKAWDEFTAIERDGGALTALDEGR
ncbi:MAG: methylmalonyl-CoA mutase subunit beta, partial [Jatrophihabitantaceae bacterium]